MKLRPTQIARSRPGIRIPRRAPYSTKPAADASSSHATATAAAEAATEAAARKHTRLDRIIARLPRPLHRYLLPLRRAPVSHVTSFLLLHEITAIVPLLALASFFHYANWIPASVSESEWVREGTEKFGRYFRRKGWFGVVGGGVDGGIEDGDKEIWRETGSSEDVRTWQAGEKGMRIVLEVAAAWAVTKALLPARLILSVWATPWFARVSVVPVMGVAKRAWAWVRGAR